MAEATRGEFVPDDDSAVLGCDVSCDREGYWVELTIGFRDEVVHHRIGPYRTERIALVAARHVRRGAGRDARPGPGRGSPGRGNEETST